MYVYVCVYCIAYKIYTKILYRSCKLYVCMEAKYKYKIHTIYNFVVIVCIRRRRFYTE